MSCLVQYNTNDSVIELLSNKCLNSLLEISRRTEIRDGGNACFNGQTTEIYQQMYGRGGDIKKGRKTK